jgi:hypothetical protein
MSKRYKVVLLGDGEELCSLSPRILLDVSVLVALALAVCQLVVVALPKPCRFAAA